MNKKFSTLVACLLAATSVGTVSAQTYATPSAAVTTKTVVPGKYYQLGVTAGGTSAAAATNVLVMEETTPNSGKYKLVVKAIGTTTLPNSLWKVVVKENSEGALSYQFVNVAANMPLSLNSATAVKPADPTVTSPAFVTPTGDALLVGGDINTWKWQPAVTTTTAFASMEMYSAFGAKLDSAVTLVATSTPVVVGDEVGAAKYALGNKATAVTNQVWLAPFEAGSVVLTADDLNSMLWTQKYNADESKVKLTFDKDVEGSAIGNLFTSRSYKAVPAVGFPADARTVAAPQTTTMTYAALQTAEVALAQANAQLALANAVRDAVMTDGKVDNAKKPLAVAALTAVASDHANISGAADVPAIVTLVEAAVSATDETSVAVEAAVVNYVQSLPLAEAKKIATGATAGVAYDLYNTEMADAAWNANATLATVDAHIAVTYVDAAGTGTKALLAARNTALSTAKTTASTGFDAVAAANGWVSLMAEKADDAKDNTYLAVDTKFVTNEGGDISRNLGFAVKKFSDVGVCDLTATGAAYATSDIARLDLNGRYNFQFQYFPSADSLVIRTAGWGKKLDDQNSWKDLNITDNPELTTANQATMNVAGTELNVVKIAILADKHREVTVGSSELKSGATPASTINTRIYIGRTTSDDRTTLASGLYFLNLKSGLATRASENNGYKVAKLTANQYGNTSAAVRYTIEDESQLLGTIQNFYNMPATQWVVEQGVGETGKELVSIYNREYPSIKVENIQLYKDANGNIAMPFAAGNYFSAADTLAFGIIKPTDSETYTNEYLGYAQIDSTILDEKIFKFDYLSGIQMGNYVNVLDSKTDSVLRVDLKGANTMFVLETAPVKAEGYFGYAGKLALGKDRMFQHLRRTAYVLKVQDGDKLIQNNKYVKMVSTTSTGEPLYVVADIKKADAAQFFLKENNEVTVENKATSYYALVGAQVIANDTLYQETADRVGVKDGSLLLSNEKYNETRVAAFALTEDNSPLYRRLGVSDPADGLKNMATDTAKIYRINATAREYLYEDAYSAYSKEKGINFLGVEGKGDAKAASLFVDTAYVRNETNMPQYMFAVGVTVVPEGMMCPENPEHNTPEYIANHGDCGHKVQTKGYVYGRYLINAQDSVVSAPNGKDYIWNEKYTRLAFVPAKHIEDTLVIYRNGKPSLAPEDSIFLGNNAHNKVTDERPNGIKNPVFALRLINDEPQCDFLIESAGNHKIPTENTGKWIAIKNGVPVVASYLTYKDAILDAEHFNIEKTAETPTANEGISTSEVSVIAGNGTVTIKGAQGKTVVIANVLGQTIANTVLSSDNAEIAAPAGVVVVAVEGEAAVKAIVK